MTTRPYNVLFLCTGNSARSILSEALLNDLARAQGKPWLGYSAGSHPSGEPHPDGLTELKKRGHHTELYRSKSWDEFTEPNAPVMDLIVTVCDNAANETCPVFPSQNTDGKGMRVHWPAPDPAHIEGASVRQKAFSEVYDVCKARIEALLTLSEDALQNRDKVQAIANITA